MPDYIPWIREKVGHEEIFLNVAAIVVFDSTNKVLLQKRSGTEELWGFPGGMMELGESAAETAIREVWEETGLKVKIDSLLGVYTKYYDEYPNGDKGQPIAIVFKGSIVGGELRVDEKETFELRFYELEKAPELFNRQHNDILDDIRNHRSGVYR
jgi:8-oxo-dGTP pyrophosphatase MutT (NUDIX family)